MSRLRYSGAIDFVLAVEGVILWIHLLLLQVQGNDDPEKHRSKNLTGRPQEEKTAVMTCHRHLSLQAEEGPLPNDLT